MTDLTIATYDHGTLGLEHGTCPGCLRGFKLRGGVMPRHGWTETGRKVGEYGRGWQRGRCVGTGMRPLEETSRGAGDIVAQYVAAAAAARTEAQRVGASDEPVTAWIPERFIKGIAAELTGLVDPTGRVESSTTHFGHVHEVRVCGGFAGSDKHRVPAHRTIRDAAVVALGKDADAFEASARAIVAATHEFARRAA